MKDRVVFLDRDGTINKEVDYLYKIEDFEFIPNAPEAIKIFHELGYKVIVITNQAGVARGYYKETDIEILHKYIDKLLEKGGTYINAYYYCPHHPDGTVKEYSYQCNCRKPETGMIDQAIRDYDVDLGRSILIGDKEIDIKTGKNSGIGKSYLVKSGHDIEEDTTQADNIHDDLYKIALELKEKDEKMKKSNGSVWNKARSD
jgi:D-glycero-D-manno-heptose 1,7-bisphosphate phosphatase